MDAKINEQKYGEQEIYILMKHLPTKYVLITKGKMVTL